MRIFGARLTPEEVLQGALGATSILIAASLPARAIYHVAVEAPAQDRLTGEIVGQSVGRCRGAFDNEAHYGRDLRNRLQGLTSTSLRSFLGHSATKSLCIDETLNDIRMPYDVSINGTEFRGEHRVAAIVYTRPNGQQAIVLRTNDTYEERGTSEDSARTAATKETLKGAYGIPDNAYRHTLPDGSTVSAYLERNGLIRQEGDRERDNDGYAWASAQQMAQILEEYEPAWPLRATGNTTTATPAISPP